MSDLIAIMSTLVDKKGKILIPGINETVAKVTSSTAIQQELVLLLYRVNSELKDCFKTKPFIILAVLRRSV